VNGPGSVVGSLELTERRGLAHLGFFLPEGTDGRFRASV
jgi:hypothetical protein